MARNRENYRPAGLSDSDDSDFFFQEPIIQKQKAKFSNYERFQSIVIQSNYAEFEAMFKDVLKNDPNFKFENGWTPLMYACFHSNPQIAEYLLDRGADPNGHSDSITPMMLLCSNSIASDEELRCIAKKLVEKGCILNLGDKLGITPLMKTVECRRKDLMEFLVTNDANLEMRDNQGWTAIFYAVHIKDVTMLSRLIQLGARVTEVDRANRTILDIAESYDHKEMINILEKHFKLHQADEIAYYGHESDDWLEYYPGLRKNSQQLYRLEIPNLLYGMHLEHLRPMILKSGIDLKNFLLMEDKDMINLGIEMEFERRRLKQGLRAFHVRNWKLKSVAGLYARQTENFSLMDCLTTAGTNLMQVYLIDVSLQYIVREFNKVKRQRKFEPPDIPVINKILMTIQGIRANILKIKYEIREMHKLVDIIRSKSPQLIQEIEEPSPYRATIEATVVGVLSFGLGYFAFRKVTRCIFRVFKA